MEETITPRERLNVEIDDLEAGREQARVDGDAYRERACSLCLGALELGRDALDLGMLDVAGIWHEVVATAQGQALVQMALTGDEGWAVYSQICAEAHEVLEAAMPR